MKFKMSGKATVEMSVDVSSYEEALEAFTRYFDVSPENVRLLLSDDIGSQAVYGRCDICSDLVHGSFCREVIGMNKGKIVHSDCERKNPEYLWKSRLGDPSWDEWRKALNGRVTRTRPWWKFWER